MRILITGGSGFIGTNLIENFITENHMTINIDIKKPRNEKHIEFWKNIDIRNSIDLQKVFVEFMPEYVIHLAARADLKGKSIGDYDTNILGVKNIIDACNKCNNIKKVIFTSTMLVCKVGYYPKKESDYCPPNLYGESKMIGENIVRENALNMKYHWSIVRPTSIWGPWFGSTYRDFFLMLIKKKYINFAGKTSTKTYGYIDNTVYQIKSILFSEESNLKTYYLGDYEPTNLTEWASQISEELGYKLKSVPIIMIWFASYLGEFLNLIKIKFPINKFRYKNMTTDNIIPLNETMELAPRLPVNRLSGIKNTIKWIEDVYLVENQCK